MENKQLDKENISALLMDYAAITQEADLATFSAKKSFDSTQSPVVNPEHLSFKSHFKKYLKKLPILSSIIKFSYRAMSGPGRLVSIAHSLSLIQDHITRLQQQLSQVEKNLETHHKNLAMQLAKQEERLAKKVDVNKNYLTSIFSKHTPSFYSFNNTVATQIDNLIFCLPLHNINLQLTMALTGFPKPGIIEWWRKNISPGCYVVDVGAHIGIYTLLAAQAMRHQGRIYSFEPMPETFKILQQNIELNKFSEITIAECCALSDSTDTKSLSKSTDDCENSSFFLEKKPSNCVNVTTISLDEKLLDCERIDLIKIAANGAEFNIFNGMNGLIKKFPHLKIIIDFNIENLRRANVEPSLFLQHIYQQGFLIKQIHEFSGKLIDISDKELLELPNSTLLLF